MKASITRRLAATLLALSAAACGGTTRATPAPAPGPGVPAAVDVHGTHAATGPAPAVNNGGHPWTEADARFMSSMIGHHAQAIVIAQLAPTHDASPEVRRLAARIIGSQEDEIATMRQWLADRGLPVPEAHAGHHDHGGGMMPGMLTPAQVAQLDAARGEDFDRLFLTFMIQHHRGAVAMVEQLFGSYGAGQDETVFKFASDVNVDQATEIDRMQRMLEALLFASPAP
ncbi:DUF305 domain-containing protein [Longimicrobium sp.]|uniref:DUF305 domain-containing protein n=1 Tax=Longimicrobium sp. TaxID=2029185 RepID=UPI003B3A7EC0